MTNRERAEKWLKDWQSGDPPKQLIDTLAAEFDAAARVERAACAAAAYVIGCDECVRAIRKRSGA